MIDRGSRGLLLASIGLLAAACSSLYPVDDPPACSVQASCPVEDLPGASLAALRSNGDSLVVTCPLADAIDAAYRSRCRSALAAALGRLARWPDDLVAPGIADVALEERQTCIDTFVSGREDADCQYHFIEAVVPLRWRRAGIR